MQKTINYIPESDFKNMVKIAKGLCISIFCLGIALLITLGIIQKKNTQIVENTNMSSYSVLE